MKQAALSLRPGTIFGYKGQVWKVTKNDTLSMTFTAQTIPERILMNAGRPKNIRERSTSSTADQFTSVTKRFQYTAGQEVDVRWVPFSNERTRAQFRPTA